MRTPDEFTSLAAALLTPRAPLPEPPPVEIERDAVDVTELVCDVRLFRARVTDAIEAAVARLLCDIAAEVLARELQLAPAMLERIVDRALHRYFSEEPVRVRVHPDDVASVQHIMPVVADSALFRGDAVVELRDGFVDASLGVRLDAVLRDMAL